MNLQKNDKIIAVVAVLVLIIAGIGIVLYMPADDEEPIKPKEDEVYEFKVTRNTFNDSIISGDFTVKDKIIGKQNYMETFDVDQDNLDELVIHVDYTDRHSGFLLKSAGADTLTVTLYDEEETEIESIQIKGSGNDSITISGAMPKNFGLMYAKNLAEAEDMLEENLSLMKTGEKETYTIEASIKTGEIFIFKPLKWIIEKLTADTFTLKIDANYYNYEVVESEYNDYGDDRDLNKDNDGEISTTTFNYLNTLGYH